MKTKMKLLKHVQYGRERLYPGCPLSKAICLDKDVKTMSDDSVGIYQTLGECEIEIEVVKKRPVEKGAK